MRNPFASCHWPGPRRPLRRLRTGGQVAPSEATTKSAAKRHSRLLYPLDDLFPAGQNLLIRHQIHRFKRFMDTMITQWLTGEVLKQFAPSIKGHFGGQLDRFF